MANQELVALIKEKFSKGERREDITAELQNEGWDIGDIDQAVSYIQHEALKQLPIISGLFKKFEVLEAKTANASPTFTIIILFATIALVGIFSYVLFLVFDPMNVKANDRDNKREADFVKLRTAIERFHNEKKQFPPRLDVLSPTYIPTIPLDPKTGAQYEYKRTTAGNYELCVLFETKNIACSSSGTDKAESIPQVNMNPQESESDTSGANAL